MPQGSTAIHATRPCSSPTDNNSAPKHAFLQSPTHARSSSGSSALSQPFHHGQRYASESRNGVPKMEASQSKARSLSPEPTFQTILSFASGYCLHQSTTPTIAKPVAIYPHEHPSRKRFSPRFSTSSASYTAYSSALASTFQQQQQQRKSNQRNRDSLDRHRWHHGPANPSIASPSEGLDASFYVHKQPSDCSYTPPKISERRNWGDSGTSYSPPATLEFPLRTDSACSLKATGMDYCSPVLSHTKISCQNSSDSVPLDHPYSPIESDSGSMLGSTRTSSPVRTQRPSSMTSSAAQSQKPIDVGQANALSRTPPPSSPLHQSDISLTQKQQRHPHQHSRHHARQALEAQSEICLPNIHHAQGDTSLTSPATVPLYRHKDSSTCTALSPSSPQAIAQSSSRYIRFLWLPLLPLLILAFGGPTSSTFDSPGKYTS